jgi:D-tyrosyl-tRNA(Tyr) deacylase
MRAIIQRVSGAQVSVDGIVKGRIGKGLVVLAGVDRGDTDTDLEFIKKKLLNLRIFSDENGKFNLSLLDICGEILLVSQFTLFGDCRKGNRPSFSRAASPENAEALFLRLKDMVESTGVPTASGVFGAHMQVSIFNDGPVTLILDSRKEVF